ncbi:MAG: polysulfide reductase NrfD [Gemmatimonadetes bacterium]|nr:polysulfide reductase NrfD [Gemmatimonadota bacterium]
MPGSETSSSETARWAKVIDHTRCIGCHACTTACKSENEVPLGVTRTYVKYADVGTFPAARRAFQVTRCNQCDDAPCTTACPTRAMFRRPDGIVDFDKSICIGCKACIAACPYDAIFINPDDHSAEKCNFCAHRIDVGLEPACVTVCPTEAILVGDLEDPTSKVAQLVGREPVAVRRPEKETHPKLFYRGAHQATLDPLAAARPDGGLFMWSEQPAGAAQVGSGHPHGEKGGGGANSSAAAVLSYDVSHKAPWDWRVSAYTLTKGIGAGAYLVALLLCLTGALTWSDRAWLTVSPILAMVGLALTGGLLIWDLEHPGRFHMIFTRPHFKSWLVRGAFVIAAYGLGLVAHLAAGLGGGPPSGSATRGLAWAVGPLAALTAIYTAYLFAQAKARDLWQNPLLPPHLLVQALLAGAAVLLVTPGFAGVAGELRTLFGLTAAIHLALVLGELTLTHSTAHAALAVHEMVRGRFALWFWTGTLAVAAAVALVVAPLAGPWLDPAIAALGLLGLLAFEHAYVQAGQSVPLA